MTILGVGFLALVGALSISTGALNGLVRNHSATAGVKSFYATESAVNEGVYQKIALATYTGATLPTGSPTLLNSSTAGTITATDLPAYRFQVKGVVSNQKTERRIIKTYTTCPACEAFSYGVYSSTGGIQLTGNASIDGNVYSGSTIDVTGNAGVIGSAEAVGTVSANPGDVTGGIAEGMTPIPTPAADYAVFEAEAIAAGTHFSTQADVDTFFDAPIANAVVYIDIPAGTIVTLKPPVTSFTGVIITTGNLDLGGTFTAATHYPAIVTKGTLKMVGNTNINGIVLVEGEVDNTGSNNVINGSLIFLNSTTNTKIKGNLDLTFDPSYFEDLENMVGFTTMTGVPTPTFLSWQEE